MKKICTLCGKEFIGCSWETECYSCKKKQYIGRQQANIRSGEDDDTFSSDGIFCPWCGEFFEDDLYDTFDDVYEEGEHEQTCPECGKKFNLTVNVSYSYETERLDNDE